MHPDDQQLIHDMKRRVRGMRALYEADALSPEKMREHSRDLLFLIDNAAERLSGSRPPSRTHQLRVFDGGRPDLGGAA